MSGLRLLNPCAKPFGPLSNLFAFRMYIDSEQWSNVNQYVYSNMIEDPSSRSKLKRDLSRSNSQCSDEKKEKYYSQYRYHKKRSEDAMISKALETALKAKYSEPKVMAILQKTGKRPIEYDDPDELLGTGEDGKGQNLVGKYSMQIRDEYRRNFVNVLSEEEQMDLYKANVAYNLLKQLIQEEGNDLSIFEPNGVKDIRIRKVSDLLSVYVARGGPADKSSERAMRVSALLGDSLAKNFFFERGSDRTLLFRLAVKSPYVIPGELRKLYLQNVSQSRLTILREKAMSLYIDYLLDKNYPELAKDKYSAAKAEQLGQITADEYDSLADNLLRFSQNLPVKLSKEIFNLKKELAPIPAPVLQRAEEFNLEAVAIAIDVDERAKRMEDKNEDPVKITAGQPDINTGNADLGILQAGSFQALSPNIFTGILEIDNLGFPSVTHYILARKFASLWSIDSLKQAFPYILRQPSIRRWDPQVGRTAEWDKRFVRNFAMVENIDKLYTAKKQEEDALRLKALAKKAMDVKFRNRALQSLLLNTERQRLLWNSKDFVLGLGDSGRGENFVGKYLETLRQEAFDRQTEENRVVLTADTLYTVVGDDTDIKLWMSKKIEDIIGVARKIISYTKQKYMVTLPLNASLVQIVLREILHWDLYDSENIALSTPTWFPQLVWQHINRKSRDSPEIVRVLWSHIAVTLQFFILGNDNPTLNDLKIGLLKLEDYLAEPFFCENVLPETPENNCILLALVNIMKTLVDCNKKTPALLPKTAYLTDTGELAEIESRAIPQEPRLGLIDITTALAILLKSRVTDSTEDDFSEQMLKAEERIAVDVAEEGEEGLAEEEYDEEENEDFAVDESDAEDGAGEDDLSAVSIYLQNRADFKYEVVQRGQVLRRNYITEVWSVSKELLKAVTTVKGYKNIPQKVLDNRVNFFATLF